MKPEKNEIYAQLLDERVLVIDPETGFVVRKEAWLKIDFLLDCLIELDTLEASSETVQ